MLLQFDVVKIKTMKLLLFFVTGFLIRTSQSFVSGACHEKVPVSNNAAVGAVAVHLHNLQSCNVSCTAFQITKVVITLTNYSTINPTNPIEECNLQNSSFKTSGGYTLGASLASMFCWSKTDQSLRATSWFPRFAYLISSFLYTIHRTKSYGNTDQCFVEVNFNTATTPTFVPTSYSSAMTTAKPSSSRIKSSTPSRTDQHVEIFSGNKDAVEVPVKGNRTLRLVCNYTCRSIQQDQVHFFWEKDGWPLHKFSNDIVYQENKKLVVFQNGSFRGDQILDLDIKSPIAQGYYQCVIKTDRRIQGNKTLVWFSDVATMIWEVEAKRSHHLQLSNSTQITFKEFETIFNKSLARSLRVNRLKRQNFNLYISPKQSNLNSLIDNSTIRITVYYRNVTRFEKLRICKIIHERSLTKDFNITSYDCCMSSATGQDSPSGEIDWPITLHGNQAKKICPFNKANQQMTSTRFCQTDFDHGPSWQLPNTEKCPTLSEVTRNLRKLAKASVDQRNKKKTAEQLRKLTKQATNFTEEMDVELSTEVLEKVMAAPGEQNQVIDDVLGSASNLMNAKENILKESQRTQNTSTRLLKLLERLSDDIAVNSTLSSGDENLAMGVNLFDDNAFRMGLTIRGFRNTTTSLQQLRFDNKTSENQVLEAYAFLSPETIKKINKKGNLKKRKISAFLFSKPVLFLAVDNSTSKQGKRKINGKILSLMVNGRRVQDLEEKEEIQNYFMPNSSVSTGAIQCVYWNFNAKGGKGDWSTKGCTLRGLQNGMYRCGCNHMTNFAILLDISPKPLTKDEHKALSIVSYIGCTISLLSLFITVITFGSFRKLRKTSPNKILLCLSTSLMITMVIFIGGSLVNSSIGCKIVAALLHYFVLTSFCWMIIEAFNIYRSFVVVFKKESSGFLKKASIFAWGVPLLIVIASTVVSQLKEYYNSSGTKNWKCMVVGLPFYIAYLTPVSLILFVNFIVLIATMVSLGKQSKYVPDKSLSRSSNIKIALLFSVLLGCTWIFGFLAIEDLKFTFQLLFCLFNSLQGFFIFVFFCARSEEVRKEWTRVLTKCGGFGKKGGVLPNPELTKCNSQTMQMEYANSWKS